MAPVWAPPNQHPPASATPLSLCPGWALTCLGDAAAPLPCNFPSDRSIFCSNKVTPGGLPLPPGWGGWSPESPRRGAWNFQPHPHSLGGGEGQEISNPSCLFQEPPRIPKLEGWENIQVGELLHRPGGVAPQTSSPQDGGFCTRTIPALPPSHHRPVNRQVFPCAL